MHAEIYKKIFQIKRYSSQGDASLIFWYQCLKDNFNYLKLALNKTGSE